MLIQLKHEQNIEPGCPYKNLPKWIQDIVKQRTRYHILPDDTTAELFVWDKTPEGLGIWDELFTYGNIQPLLQFHQSKKK